MRLRKYTMLDMIRMTNYSRLRGNKKKSPLELIKEYNEKYPGLTPAQLFSLLKTHNP
jgi:hypothetical protein